MPSEQKTNTQEKTQAAQQTDPVPGGPQAVTHAPTQPKKSSNAAIWVLVGCLAIFLIGGLLVLALVLWGGWRMKKSFDETVKPELDRWQQASQGIRERADQFGEQLDSVAGQMESITGSVPQTFEEPSGAEEKAVGYVKRVYEQSGKRYLEIDYIQWLTGSAAEKAMREDGACPERGECIVANDYYIRNQNPRLRTFEISPQAKIYSQTQGMKETGLPSDKEISFVTFKNLFNSGSEWEIQNNPYGIELASGTITKITQYYIP